MLMFKDFRVKTAFLQTSYFSKSSWVKGEGVINYLYGTIGKNYLRGHIY